MFTCIRDLVFAIFLFGSVLSKPESLETFINGILDAQPMKDRRLSEPKRPTKRPPTPFPGPQGRRFSLWEFEKPVDKLTDDYASKRSSQPGPTKYPPTGSPGSQGRRFSYLDVDKTSNLKTDDTSEKQLSHLTDSLGSDRRYTHGDWNDDISDDISRLIDGDDLTVYMADDFKRFIDGDNFNINMTDDFRRFIDGDNFNINMTDDFRRFIDGDNFNINMTDEFRRFIDGDNFNINITDGFRRFIDGDNFNINITDGFRRFIDGDNFNINITDGSNFKRLSLPGPIQYPATGSTESVIRRFSLWGDDDVANIADDNSVNHQSEQEHSRANLQEIDARQLLFGEISAENKRLSQPGPTRYPPTGSPGSPKYPPFGLPGPPGSNRRDNIYDSINKIAENMLNNNKIKRLSQPGPTRYPPTGSPGSPNYLTFGPQGHPGPHKRENLVEKVSKKMFDGNKLKRLSQPGPTRYPPTGSPGTLNSQQEFRPWRYPTNNAPRTSELFEFYNRMTMDNKIKRNHFHQGLGGQHSTSEALLSNLETSDTDTNKRMSPPGPTFHPPLAEISGSRNLCSYLGSIVIESSGQWENSGVTVEVSFPAPAEFSWILGYTVSEAQYTRGKYNTVAGRTSSILSLDDFDLDAYELSLTIKFPTGGVYLRLDTNALRAAGTMHVTCPGPLLGKLPEVRVPETGDAILFLPLFWGLSGHPSMDAFYTYLNTSSQPYTVGGDILFSTLSHEDFSVEYKPSNEEKKRIYVTLDSRVRQYGGTINVHLSMLDVNNASSPSFVKFANIHKTLNIRPNNTTRLTAGVAFGSWEPELETRVFPNCIRHGSISCSAVGNPSPDLRLYKDGVQLDTFGIGENGVSKRVFYPLDGKRIKEISGLYTCQASSGNMTITRYIRAVPID